MGLGLKLRSSKTTSSNSSKTSQIVTNVPPLRPLMNHIVDRQLPERFIKSISIEDPDRRRLQARNDNERDAKPPKKPRTPLPNGKPLKFASRTKTIRDESSADSHITETLSAPGLKSQGSKQPTESDPRSFPSRLGFLDDYAEIGRILRRKHYHDPRRHHRRPDGYKRYLKPPESSVGRLDKLGNPVPLLTLTTPTEEGKPWTGETVYLHDGNQWPIIPGDDDRRWASDFMDMKHQNSVGRVSRRRYERRGAELEAKRAREAYRLDALHLPHSSRSSTRTYLGDAGRKGSSRSGRTPLPNKRRSK